MMIRFITILAVMLLVVSSPLFAGKKVSKPQKIRGAFGYKLGQVLRPTEEMKRGGWHAVNTSVKTGKDSGVYVVIPKKPFSYFSHYYVGITLVTNRVWGIEGYGKANSEKECNKRFRVLHSIVMKYGNDMDEFDDRIKIFQGSRQVWVGCSYTMVSIRYIDMDLVRLSKKEEGLFSHSKHKKEADKLKGNNL